MNQLQIYNDIGIYSEILGAPAKRQIQLLMEKLIADIHQATTAIEMKKIPEKCKRISSANHIIDYLRDCIDFSADPKLAATLDQMYGHLEKQLFIANSTNNPVPLKECAQISSNIKTWWDNVAAA